MLDVGDFRELVVRPSLIHLQNWDRRLWTEAAENLLIGTALQESGLRHLRQMHGGIALSVYQIEPATALDVWDNFLSRHPRCAEIVEGLMAPAGDRVGQLTWNLGYATAVARLIYWRGPEPPPPPENIDGLGRYWKDHYNTAKGGGTAAQFIFNYRTYVLAFAKPRLRFGEARKE